MGRKKVFSDQELEEIAREAIAHITSENPFLYQIERIDIAKYAQRVYPGFSYYHSSHKVIRDIITEYNDRKSAIARRGNGNVNQTERFIKNLNVDRVIYELNRGDYEVKEILTRIKEECNFLVLALQVTREENIKMSEYVSSLANGKLKSTENIVKRAEEWEKKYREKVVEVEKLKKELDLIQDRAARLTIVDCHMGTVTTEKDDRATVITYLDHTRARKERLRELRGKRDDD